MLAREIRMIERMGVDIVQLDDLQGLIHSPGCTSGDRKVIYVDKFVSEKREARYRYTLAHEVGHIVLHQEMFDYLLEKSRTTGSWRELVRTGFTTSFGVSF